MPDAPVKIVLRSDLFRDNERLQRAASDHRYHVTLGDEGEHVRRIQMFLVIHLQVADVVAFMRQYVENGGGPQTVDYLVELELIDQFQTETFGALYGPRTASYVRTFKFMKNIVDRSRQSAPDGIVGVRTIRAMDDVAANGLRTADRGASDREGAAMRVANHLKPAVMAGPVVGARMLAAGARA